jgi:hypothetical protein
MTVQENQWGTEIEWDTVYADDVNLLAENIYTIEEKNKTQKLQLTLRRLF